MRNRDPHNFNITQIAIATGVFTRFSKGLILVVLSSYVVFAQEQIPTASPTPTPSASETRLIEQNRILALEKTNAELRKDIRDAQPQPSATPLEGKTTVDENVVIETQMVTYKAMSDVAERIGAEIRQNFNNATSISIFDADELQNLRHYQVASPVLDGRIKSMEHQYSNVFDELNSIALASARTSTRFTVTSDPNVPDSSTMESTTTTSFPTTPSAVGATLRTFADLLALLRSDTEIKGKSVTVEESAVVAETFRALRNKFGSRLKLYYPAVVSPGGASGDCSTGTEESYCSATLRKLAGLYALKEQAEAELLKQLSDVASEFEKMTRSKAAASEDAKTMEKQIDDRRLERLKAELAKPWTKAQVHRFERYLKELEVRKDKAETERDFAETRLESAGKKKSLLESLQTLNRQADEMVASLAKPDEKTGRSELANFIRAENMVEVMGIDSYWLELRSISAGGNNRTRKNLFRYFSGAKLDHSGGIIVEWTLYDRNGASVESNKDSSYPGYHTPKEIRNGKLRDAVSDTPVVQTPVIAKSGDQ